MFRDYKQKLFASLILRHSSITFLGTVVNGLLGAMYYIVLARVLGPGDFGILTLAITVLTLLTDIFNLGTDSSLVKFVSSAYKTDKYLAHRFLKLIFEIRIITGLLVLILGYILAPIIADGFFNKPVLVLPLRLAFLGVGFSQFFAFSLSLFQAYQNFWGWSFIQIGTNFVRLLLIIGLLIFFQLNLSTSLSIYILVPLFGFLTSLFFLPTDYLKVKDEKAVLPKVLNYSKWIAFSVIIASFSSRIETFISGRLLSAIELGYYAAALQLCIIIPQIMRSLDAVIAPQMSQLKTKAELKSYLIKAQLLVLALFALGIISSPIVLFLIPKIFGSTYQQALPPIFLILLLANLIFLLSLPTHNAVNYFWGNTKLFTYTSLLNLMVAIILGWYLISSYRIIGAALSVLVTMSLNFLIPGCWLIYKLQQDE